VAVLNIGSGTKHVFDCITSEGSASSLSWEKNEGVLRFPVTTESVHLNGMDVMVRRMNLNPTNGEPAGFSDVGLYTCVLNQNEMVSINITGSKQTLSSMLRHDVTNLSQILPLPPSLSFHSSLSSRTQ